MRKNSLWFLALFSAISLYGISASFAQDASDVAREASTPEWAAEYRMDGGRDVVANRRGAISGRPIPRRLERLGGR